MPKPRKPSRTSRKAPVRRERARKTAARARRRRTTDERGALLAALPRLLVTFARSRIDALEQRYDAAHDQARHALGRGVARAKHRPEIKQARERFQRASAALKREFAADAALEADAIRRLQASIMSAIALTKNEIGGGIEGWAEISWAFAEWSWEARWRKLTRERRLSAWLAEQAHPGVTEPKPRRELRAMFGRAQRALSSMRKDEDVFRAQAASERDQIAEWSRNVQRARAAGAMDLATEAESRIDQHEAVARELETEVAAAAASRQRFERSLSDIGTRLAAR